MRTLLEDIQEPNSQAHDIEWEAFYRTVDRIDPWGNPIKIDVEIYYNWQDDSIVDYATVTLGELLANGLSIQHDAMLFLSDEEMKSFRIDQEVEDVIIEGNVGYKEIQEANEDYDRNR